MCKGEKICHSANIRIYFSPFKVGKLTLKNRITNAPTYNFLASYDNHITREGIEFSKPVGQGGAATVTLGSGFINKVLPPAAHHIVGLNDDWVVTYLSEWCEAVKRYGAKACVELVPIASYFGTHEVESSVGIPMEIDCNLLSLEELQGFIADYAKAARNVLTGRRRYGFNPRRSLSIARAAFFQSV